MGMLYKNLSNLIIIKWKYFGFLSMIIIEWKIMLFIENYVVKNYVVKQNEKWNWT